MTEDILEQLGIDWLLQSKGQFVKSNLKYRPDSNHPDFISQIDTIHSDIDLISVDFSDLTKVKIFNCKSWMDGFDCKFFNDNMSDSKKHNKKFGGKEIWKHFRELLVPKWTQAFVDRIRMEVPTAKTIDYSVLCIFAKNNSAMKEWMTNSHIQSSFSTMPLKIGSFRVLTIQDLIKNFSILTSNYAESTHLGRTLQLLKAGYVI